MMQKVKTNKSEHGRDETGRPVNVGIIGVLLSVCAYTQALFKDLE